MIIVPIKEGENIEKALKKFKRKFEKTGVVRELRSRKQFEKPSVKRRNEIRDQEGYLRTASQTERGVIPYRLSDSYIIPAESISGLPVFL